jgi:hypothetical protein
MTAMDWTIAVRMWAWAAALRVLKRVVPLKKMVRLVHPGTSALERSPEFEHALETYMSTTAAFPFRAPGNCLERSLGAYRLLCARNAHPELVIGVRYTAKQAVEGHVWVRVDGRALAERPEDVQSYTAVVTFDATGRQHASVTSNGSLAGVPLA